MKGWKNNNDPWLPLHDKDSQKSSKTSSGDTAEQSSIASISRVSDTSMSDSPELQEFDVRLKLNQPLPVNDPLHTFIDSERYIQSLERKLGMLKKKKENPSSKDIIDSLALFNEDQMRSYVDSNSQSTEDTIDSARTLTPSYTKRKLFPELQAINTAEITELVKEDFVEKAFENFSGDRELKSHKSGC